MHRTEGANSVLDSDGHRVYTAGPPPTTITPEAMNALQEEICNVIENAGFILKTADNDTRDQLWNALLTLGRPYDFIISSQTTFSDVIERVSANRYRFKSQYRSLFFQNITGGYSNTFYLSDGDTWGYIETNACSNIKFEAGTYINMGNERGYIKVNTEGCFLDNVSVRGLGTAASAITNSFLLAANYVTFNSCTSSTRLSNTNYNVFEGSATALHNTTSSYRSCTVSSIDSSGEINGFYLCKNISDCLVYDIESTGNNIAGYKTCNIMNNCKAIKLDSTAIISGFYDCNNIATCYCEDLDSSANTVYGFYLCDDLSSCRCFDIASAGGTVTGYNLCNQMVGCYAKQLDHTGGAAVQVAGFAQSKNVSGCGVEDIDSNGTLGVAGFIECEQVSACYVYDINATAGSATGYTVCKYISGCKVIQQDATSNSYGFTLCLEVSSCYAEDIDSSAGNAYGFYDCDYIASSKATTCNTGFVDCAYISSSASTSNSVDGFNNCDTVGQCLAFNNTVNGFTDCNRLSINYSASSGADGYNNCDTVLGCYAVNNTGDGFQDCNHIEHNRSTGSGGAAYNNCFADLGATRAAAATDAGGENA